MKRVESPATTLMAPNQAVISLITEPKSPWAPQQITAEPEPTPLQISVVVMNPIPIELLKGLRSDHDHFLSGFSRHPHNSRERILDVEVAQHPIAAVLGSADSRLPVELLFDIDSVICSSCATPA